MQQRSLYFFPAIERSLVQTPPNAAGYVTPWPDLSSCWRNLESEENFTLDIIRTYSAWITCDNSSLAPPLACKDNVMHGHTVWDLTRKRLFKDFDERPSKVGTHNASAHHVHLNLTVVRSWKRVLCIWNVTANKSTFNSLALDQRKQASSSCIMSIGNEKEQHRNNLRKNFNLRRPDISD